MAIIFLSYKHEDEIITDGIQKALERAGHEVWRDTQNIGGGTDWLSALEEAVKGCDILVSVVSQAWEIGDDKWVKTEFLVAAELKKPTVPIIIDNSPVPFYMKTISVISAGNDLNSGVQKVIGAIEIAAQSIPEASNQPDRANGEAEQNYIQRIITEYVRRKIIDNPLSGKRYAETGDALIDSDVKVLDAIQSLRQVIILGEPGAGKSTALLQIRHKLAQKITYSKSKDHQGPLPILIELGALQPDISLSRYIEQQLNLGQATSNSLSFNALKESNRVALLLDGLNEFPPSRLDVLQEIRQLVRDATDSNMIIIITCREQDYQNEALRLPLPKEKILHVEPLNSVQIYKFLQDSLGAQSGDELFWQLAGVKAQSAWHEFKSRVGENMAVFWLSREKNIDVKWGENSRGWAEWQQERDSNYSLLKLATNPYMLRLLILLYEEEGRVPQNRAMLFKEVTRLWLVKEAREQGVDRHNITNVVEDAIGKLSRLSFAIQRQKKETSFDAHPVYLYLGSREHLEYKMAVGANILRASMPQNTRKSLRSEMNYIYSFTHQLFQEYFAALHLRTEMKKATAAEIIWEDSDWSQNWWRPSHWDETILLLTGFFNETDTVIKWLAKDNPLLAMRCIDECGIPTTQLTLDALKSQWINGLTDKKLYRNPIGRAAIGRELGRRSWDTRDHIGLDSNGQPDIGWIRIDQGDFRYQDNDKVEGLAAFEISKYPITYGQYSAFVNDGGYDNRMFWTEAGWAWREAEQIIQPLFGWNDPKWHINNHPIIGVTWYEAVAFCNWLIQYYPNYIVRLPSEYQWEKAARGTIGLQYPYGNKRDVNKCNLEETGIGCTSAVGIFPDGKSPYGVEDMCGNVWELCLNKFDNITDTDEEVLIKQKDGVKRTLRGCSWYIERSYGRATARFRFFQQDYDDYTGFRVVRMKKP